MFENIVELKIKYKDLSKLEKLYKYKIIRYYGPISIINKIQNNKLLIIQFIAILIMIIIYTNIIIDIKIETNNTNYYNLINKELKNNNIVKYSIALNENKLYEIKNKILEENKNIEWININRVGMAYNIKFQPKIINNPKEEHNNCDIVSTKEELTVALSS